MKRIEFKSDLLREQYCRMEHRSGLTIYVFPKKLCGTYALLSTGFGSIDTHFFKGDQANEIVVPDGTASIWRCTFSGCRKVEKILLPDSVSYIGMQSFS